MIILALLVLLGGALRVTAHVAMWDKGMFGYNYPKQATDSEQLYNSNIQMNPLRQSDALVLDEWWGHGYLDYPPVPGDFMELPSGGVYVGDISCNRAFTKMGNPRRGVPLPLYACDNEGSLHTKNKFGQPTDRKLFGGSAIGIAYTSDPKAIKPNDMTIISVNQDSVFFRETRYPIPAGLPPCPPAGCICSWNWIHRSNNGEGYGAEIYHLLYRCKVTGAIDTSRRVQRGAVPKDCTGNPSSCVRGPKTGLYAFQRDGNNMIVSTPPTYSDDYGFSDGAQNDIFTPAATPAPTTYLVNPYATNPTKTFVDPLPTAASLPPGWRAIGCTVDQALPKRYLGGLIDRNATQNTISSCVQKCVDLKMTSAGLQQGTLCWCGNATGPPVMAPESECNIRCPGDLWSFCGGVWRNSLFSLIDWTASKQSSVANSTTTAQATTAAITPTTATTTSAPALTTAAPPVEDDPTPSASSSPASATQSSGISAPQGWTYVGCNGEPSGIRALNGMGLYMPQMTLESCTAVCAEKGYTYAGMQYSTECYCGNTYTPLPSTGCDSPCAGNAAQKCGGNHRNSIFIAADAASRNTRSRRDMHYRHRGRGHSLLDRF